MSKSNNYKTPAQRKSVRLIAIILAVLMAASVATIGIGLLVDVIANSNDTTQSDSHEGHNHD